MKPREHFKEALARFEPSGDPGQALKNGLYVEDRNQSLAHQTLIGLKLHPKSSHLLAGPSGTGKTMQLRVLERELSNADDLIPIFLDATTQVDLNNPGMLKDHLAKQVDTLIQKIQIHEPQAGTLLALDILASLFSDSPEDPRQNVDQLKRRPVLLLDSLDRLPIEVFNGLCAHDLAAIRGHVAVVVVGPPAVMYGAAEELKKGFDYFITQPAYDPMPGGEVNAFLMQILRQRSEEDMLPIGSCAALIEASGGVIRDLISLTQLAIGESYVAGHNHVEFADVQRALNTFRGCQISLP